MSTSPLQPAATAYCSIGDLVPSYVTQAEMVQLTDDAGSGAVNQAVVTAKIQEATGIIESYLRKRYTTPLQPSDLLTSLACAITVYLIFTRRRNAKIQETIRDRYTDAMKMLGDLSAGRASLDQPASVSQPQNSDNSVQLPTWPAGRIFDDCNLKGF